MLENLFRSHLKIKPSAFPDPAIDEPLTATPEERLAVLAGGCFWCTEAVYRELKGVTRVVSGYSGGKASNADYESVCTGRTEHAEVIQITYNAAETSFGQLLKIFFAVAHDPTQLNRQGNDVGSQYRSAIFYANEEQKALAEAYIQQINAAEVFNATIATRLEKLGDFFAAETYHQNYAALHPEQGYVAAVSAPKVEKLRAYFGEQLKN